MMTKQSTAKNRSDNVKVEIKEIDEKKSLTMNDICVLHMLADMLSTSKNYY